MNDVRIMFEKTGRAAYISHLDIMRTFHRIFIRTGVALRHSEGFSPHPKMSVILPLPLGCRGYGEILDAELLEPGDPAALPERLNPFMPEGIRALEAVEPLMKPGQIKFALWRVELLYGQASAEDRVQEIKKLLAEESLVISRKTKRGIADFDLAPYTGALNVSTEVDKVILEGPLPAQEPSVNPAFILNALKKFLPDAPPLHHVCSRISLYDESMRIFR